MKNIFTDKKISCIILSAGLSERMTTHKALLQFSKEESFLTHIIKVYREAGIKNLTVVINPEIEIDFSAGDFNGVAFVKNNFPERGRLYSLQLGLEKNADVDCCFVQNIDNPFVTEEIIVQLYESRLKADYVTPIIHNKGGHPFLISSNIIRQIISLKNFDIRLNDFLEKFSRHKVSVTDENILVNINTQDEYKKYFGKKINQHYPPL